MLSDSLANVNGKTAVVVEIKCRVLGGDEVEEAEKDWPKVKVE
jgi:hypothetical protein